MGYRRSWTDRIKETLSTHKVTVIGIAVAIALAVAISGGMIHGMAPSKSAYNEDMARIGATFTGLNANVTNLTGEVDGLEDAALETKEQLQGVSDKVAGHTGDIGILTTRMGNAEGRIATVEEDVAEFGSPPEGYLTGTFGNYTLHAKSSEAGNFTANVHLVYSRVFGCNGTYEECQQHFYSGINWTKGTPFYTTVVTFNGTAWGVSQVWFNIGTFALAANNETSVNIIFGGMNNAYKPDFAYAEVYPILR